MVSDIFFAVYNFAEKAWFAWWRFWFKTIIGKFLIMSFGLVLLAAMLMMGQYYLKHKDDKTQLGVSFSTKYAWELGLDWENSYRALIEDLGFEKIRIMSYWDEYEKEDDEFDFTILDKQFEIAEQNDVLLNLGVGARQPRWPECHEPAWADELDAPEFEAELLEFIEAVVTRYKDSPALEQYQLENEYFLPTFGECGDATRQRLQNEFDLIKSIDSTHPVIINVSNQLGTPIQEPVGDKTGFSMYRKAHGRLYDLEYYWDFWYAAPQWHTLRASFIELIHDSDTFVHELQTEPWGSQATVNMSIEEQNLTMDAPKIRTQVEYAENTGMNEVFMWGGEWWYWRATEFQDDSLWEEVRDLLQERE